MAPPATARCVHCNRTVCAPALGTAGPPLICDPCTESIRVHQKPLDPVKSSPTKKGAVGSTPNKTKDTA